jgi:Cyclin M transmembrane N-terminal domain
LAIGLVAEPSLATLLRGPLEALGFDADVTEVAAIALTLLLATAVQMVFGELVPKNIALSRPADSVVWVVIPLLVFTKVTRPLIVVLNGSANQLLRLVGVEPVEELRSARTPDELASVRGRAGEHRRLWRRRSTSGNDRSGGHVITWGEDCEEHPGDCVRDTQRRPEAEISLRRQRPAEYQEPDSERCRQQKQQTGPANAGTPSPLNQDLAQQDRSNDQDQECSQEDRVANLALGSASGHGVELDAVP